MADITVLIGVTDVNSLGALSPVFKVVQQMTDTYQHIKFGRKRCKGLIQQAAILVKGVHSNLQREQNSVSDISKLQSKFEEVHAILKSIADLSFFKALLRFEDINKRIERAYSHLAECSKLFPTVQFSSPQVQATILDQEALRALLKMLAGNYAEIRRLFGISNDGEEDQAMLVMERELRNARVAAGGDMPVEMQIMQKSLECIKSTTGRSAPKQKKWHITECDLEDCGIIGGGGFATVSKAQFRYMMVAVKTFKDSDAGHMREVLETEVEIWSGLHHDHIVPFYGASILSSPPFIVSRYMKHGNLVQYLAKTPNIDRTKLLFEVSLGMYYLHEEDVVHGDLKGVNVLVDDAGKACITDFGLSKIHSSRTVGMETGKIAGTLRYLAPEALKGQQLSFETDVYAFGMLIYEVFTGDVPFINEPDHMVIEGRVELQRPKSNEVYERGFSDALWRLLSDCISNPPSSRPRFKTIQATLYSLKKLEPSVPAVLTTPNILGTNNTNWGLDTSALLNNVTPVQKNSNSIGEQSIMLSRRTVPRSPATFPPTFPTCIEVTHKHFGVKFSISSKEPGVYIEETNQPQWQPIRAKKRSLIDGPVGESVPKFWYRSATGNGNNSWELNGVDVTLTTAANTGICRFKDTWTAQKWFRLQLSYARNGSVGDWGTEMGDWIYTERGWRCLTSDNLQQADGGLDIVPSDSWKDIDLPKRCVMDEYATTENCVVCITNPTRQPGRFCCKFDGRKIIFETYRRQGDKDPVTAREETYPSDEYAKATFHVVKAALERVAGKSNKTGLFSLMLRGDT